MSFQYLTEETKLTIIPANCPDVSFWTLVNFSWWWGGSAENKKLTPTSSEHLLVLCHYLWIIEVGRQLHEYRGQKLGDIVGERLHKCTQSKDSTEIFFVNSLVVIWSGLETCGERDCPHCLRSQSPASLLPLHSLFGIFAQSWSHNLKIFLFRDIIFFFQIKTLPSWAWSSSSSLSEGGQRPLPWWIQNGPNLPRFSRTSAAP